VVRKRAVLIAGPTASGKSALALARARETGALVVNTDALQVYDGLRVVTARPSEAEMAGQPHRLYGTVAPDVRFSTGDWARAAGRIISEAADQPLIFVGGTGLYFEALTKGIADVPEVPAKDLAWAEAEVKGLSRDQRAKLIADRDPETAAMLKAPDPQRVIRALAVLRATGRSLASFQKSEQRGPLHDYELEKLVLNPEREILRQRIHDRFLFMLDHGATEEVSGLSSLGLDPTLPVMKAIGVREIADWQAGTATREAMIKRAVAATRQYAKRQRTWFRGRMSDWSWVS
jgi:tRNA dimethylallyltransferase